MNYKKQAKQNCKKKIFFFREIHFVHLENILFKKFVYKQVVVAMVALKPLIYLVSWSHSYFSW